MNAQLQPGAAGAFPATTPHDDVMVPTYSPSDMVPVRALGLDVWDRHGRRYLDFTSGIGVTSLGHGHPAVVDALTRQARQLWHVGNGYTNEPVRQLARALVDATFAERVFFCNSGAEANEAALKLARRHASVTRGAGKARIVSCVDAFHGRPLFTVSASGQAKYAEGFGPLPGQIEHIPFNDIGAVQAAIGDDVCAVIVEPVQGESGVRPASAAFLLELRAACNRTGALFAYEQYGVVPDILTIAKALGNGYPVAAMLTDDEIGKSFSAGSHGSTFGGNPLAAAVALTVLQTINAPAFLRRVNEAAAVLAHTLQGIANDYQHMFAGVRGRGLMQGMLLSREYAGQAKAMAMAAEAEGVMLLTAGMDVLRFLPALVVTNAQIAEAGAMLRHALDDFDAIQRRSLMPLS